MKHTIKRIFRTFGFDIIRHRPQPEFPPDFTEEEIEIIQTVRPYTGTSPERLVSLIRAVRYVVHNKIAGDVIECGVWRGGSMMAVAHMLRQLHDQSRHLYLFDTFEGFTKPGERDVNLTGQFATTIFEQKKRVTDDGEKSDWCYVPLESVQQAVLSTGYDPAKIHFVKGRVEATIPEAAPTTISLLRLDTDWYESTRHELVHLFPRLSSGGVLIIDDYGHWRGSREATDEYVTQNHLRLLLNRIDYTGRLVVKP